ncbi:hypothetical protein [Bacillus wiedmannii]|uniref:hypothetical protein n=1 Tax=Bacillus wiedmannii TaxID=1890302 RepID=UPI002EB69F22|nr:hypothetical protein [Bacillus wiedmannii]
MNESRFEKLRSDVFSYFNNEEFEPIEVTEKELVTLTIDENFQVKNLSILANTNSFDIYQLEKGLIVAFNKAVQKVADLHGKRLSETILKNRSN